MKLCSDDIDLGQMERCDDIARNGQIMSGHSPDLMGSLVRETFRAMVGRVEHLFDDTDIILSQWLTLKLIGTGKIECIGDVTRELDISSGASTRLVDQLENRGFLCRCRSGTDRRVVGIALTGKGIAVVEQLQPRLTRFWEDQLQPFSSEERDLLITMLARLRDGLLK